MEEINYNDSSMNETFINAREYEEATRTVVRTLGRDAGCDVMFVGENANIGKGKTNKIVTLPANDPNGQMTKRQYFIGQGYANHETLHSLCTDIDGCGPRLKEMSDHKQHLTWALSQGIEDVRIEHAGMKLYPGVPTKLDATMEFSCQHFLKRDDVNDIVIDFKKVGPLAITWMGRKRLGYTSPSMEACIKLIPEDIYKRVDGYVDQVMNLATGACGIGDIDRVVSFKGSHDAIDLAYVIAKEIMQKKDESQPQSGCSPQTGAGESSSAGSGGEGGSGSESGNPGSDKSGGSEKGKAQNENNGHGAASEKEFITQPETIDPDFLLHVGKELEVKRNPNGYSVLSTALDTWTKGSDKTNAAKNILRNPHNLISYKETMDGMTGKMAVMRRKLERALNTKMARDYTTGHRTGKIDVARRGTQILRGRENVFRKKEEGKDIDSAVSILIDASGSMSGSRLQLAQQSCIALAESIARVGVPLEILAFNTRAPSSDEIPNLQDIHNVWNTMDSENYSRASPVAMYEIKNFEDNMTQARKSMGGIRNLSSSSNCDSESVLKAWDRLKRRPEKNKILLVMSDGEPICRGIHPHQIKHLRDIVQLVGEEGGKCVGIGIQSEAVKKYYPKYTIVNKLDELAGVTLDNIARMILGERFIIDNGSLIDSNKQDARASRNF